MQPGITSHGEAGAACPASMPTRSGRHDRSAHAVLRALPLAVRHWPKASPGPSSTFSVSSGEFLGKCKRISFAAVLSMQGIREADQFRRVHQERLARRAAGVDSLLGCFECNVALLQRVLRPGGL